MSSETWVHIGIVGTCIVPILLMWWDTRRQQSRQHTENQVRLGKIETMLGPIWDWWNSGENGGKK